MDWTNVASWAGVASSFALVVSVLLLAYNMMLSRRDVRRNLALAMLERLAGPDIGARRWKMSHAIADAAARGWVGFDDSLEDFECRSFVYLYELIGQMVDRKILDYPSVREFLQFSIVTDWNSFAPLEARLVGRFNPGGVRRSPWDRFHALALRITTDLHGPPLLPRRSVSPSAAAPPGPVPPSDPPTP